MNPAAPSPSGAPAVSTAPGQRLIIRSGHRAPRLLAAVATGTAVAVNLPLVYLFARAAQAGPESYLRAVFSGATWTLLLETLALVAGVLAVAIAIAVPMAWLVARTDLPGRGVWGVLGALPLVFPSYIAAFSIVAVLGPRGFLQGWLEPLGVQRLPELAYGYSGALLALALFTYPYIYLPLVAALRGLDPALEESARSLGASRLGTFVRVVIPQLRRPLFGGSLLVVLYVISDFGAVSIVRYNTLTLGIYNAYSALFDRRIAACLATVLVVLALAFVAAQGRLVRNVRPTRGRPTRPVRPVSLGRWKAIGLLFLSAVALLTVVVPAGVPLFWGVRAVIRGNPLGHVGSAAVSSVVVSAMAAIVAIALSVPVAAWAVRYPGRPSALAERLAYSGHALPGLVIALALVFFASRFAAPVYQTLGLLVAAYVVRFLPEALASVHASLAAVRRSAEEAARSLGRGPLEVLASVTLPMIRPGLLAGAGLVFLTCMKELPATLILRPIGFETLATRIWSTAAEGIYSEAAAPSLLLLIVTTGPLYLLFIRPMLAGRR